MAVYRSDQAQLTFTTEAVQGGYPELASSVTDDSTAFTAVVNGAITAGATSFSFDAGTGTPAVGDDIQIGPEVGGSGTYDESEIRRIVFIDSWNSNTGGGGTATVHLNAPVAFNHLDNAAITRVTATAATAADIYIDQIPGVYETVDCPDPEMAIEPRYFLGTASKRNFFSAYKGQQAYNGSVPGFLLLNGRSLRYPIGSVTTTPSAYVGSNNVILLNGATKKGDVFIKYDGANANTMAADVIVCIDDQDATVREVRKVVSVTGGTDAKLDYPLQFAHADNASIARVAASGISYTHAIRETVDLDTVSWHVHLRDSSETAANDFDRRYFGGMVGSATIAAEEGGMLTMSWDSVNFLGMVHNQMTSTETGRVIGNNAVSTPFAGLMKTIDNDEVDFATTNPYYFSEGDVQIYGQTIARVRSFSLSIANGEEPRYYIQRRHSGNRGPTEIRENRREYTCSMTLALPDSQATTSATSTLFKELLLEGDYGSGMEGFNIVLTFTRGTDDTITITIPDDGNAETGGNAQGAFIRTAAHDITGDNPMQVDADILFRNMKIDVVDSLYYYP